MSPKSAICTNLQYSTRGSRDVPRFYGLRSDVLSTQFDPFIFDNSPAPWPRTCCPISVFLPRFGQCLSATKRQLKLIAAKNDGISRYNNSCE